VVAASARDHPENNDVGGLGQEEKQAGEGPVGSR